ncbi:MAG TPA: T9SS type A sorting domain-containing protein, partial [Chitinophagales bacterium]|nr:T9SS type A sorting domain-containing protein [Chitinophagales bacterium]
LYSSTVVVGASYEWYLGASLKATTSTPYLKISIGGSYTVKVIKDACPSITSASFPASLTAVRNNKLEIKYMVVPNPNNGMFELNITSGSNKTYQLKLFSVSGQIILTDEINLRAGLNNKRFNITDIEKGVYFLSVIGEEGISTQAVLIQ